MRFLGPGGDKGCDIVGVVGLLLSAVCKVVKDVEDSAVGIVVVGC